MAQARVQQFESLAVPDCTWGLALARALPESFGPGEFAVEPTVSAAHFIKQTSHQNHVITRRTSLGLIAQGSKWGSFSLFKSGTHSGKGNPLALPMGTVSSALKKEPNNFVL